MQGDFFGYFPNTWFHGDNIPFPAGIEINAFINFAKMGLKFLKRGALFSMLSFPNPIFLILLKYLHGGPQ